MTILPEMVTQAVKDRFWSKVTVRGEDECWEWNGRLNSFTVKTGITTSPQKVSFIINHGFTPEAILERGCRNHSCVNPSHIYECTDIDSVGFSMAFWSGVRKAGKDECWNWKKSIVRGYGQSHIQGHPEKSHRVAFRITYGYWPNIARHTCDNPICCNPSHLIDGTHKDNTQDMLSRGRCNPPVGERSGHAKLTDEKVIEIRREYSSFKTPYIKLAEKYGVCFQLIGQIVTRKIWCHV